MHVMEENANGPPVAGPVETSVPGRKAPPPERAASRSIGWLSGLAGLAFFLMPLGYALYTGHVWEDYFITFRYSRNLALGNGLVFEPGERVHGFTSPINVLVPALFDRLNGSRSYEFPLWAFRIVSAAAFAAAGLLLTRLMQRESGSRNSASVLFALLFLLDFKAVAFSANGQETAFVLLFLALGFVCTYRGPTECWTALAVSWAGLLWTRPDGCVYAAMLTLAGLLFGVTPARRQLPALAKAAALCTVLYLPWFLAAWVYYGTPVPHTVIAKAIGPNNAPTGVPLVKWVLQGVVDVASYTSAPIYMNFGGWPTWVAALCLVLGLFCAIYWAIPSADRLGRMASLVYLLGCLYLSFYTATSYNGFPFPWYLPPVNLFGIVVLARSPATLIAKVGPTKAVRTAAAVLEVGLVAGMALIFLMGCRQIRIQQREIELGMRVPIGRWLAKNVAPTETVYCESLGYFGFFSQRHMLDWPGLVSPRVVQARRNGHNDFVSVIPVLMPDWVILRPHELVEADRKKVLLEHYKLANVFDVSAALSDYASLPGISYLLLDQTFVIMKRKHEPNSGRPTGVAP
jgi:hypothetical protein